MSQLPSNKRITEFTENLQQTILSLNIRNIIISYLPVFLAGKGDLTGVIKLDCELIPESGLLFPSSLKTKKNKNISVTDRLCIHVKCIQFLI